MTNSIQSGIHSYSTIRGNAEMEAQISINKLRPFVRILDLLVDLRMLVTLQL
jgi:hypothetical protein